MFLIAFICKIEIWSYLFIWLVVFLRKKENNFQTFLQLSPLSNSTLSSTHASVFKRGQQHIFPQIHEPVKQIPSFSWTLAYSVAVSVLVLTFFFQWGKNRVKKKKTQMLPLQSLKACQEGVYLSVISVSVLFIYLYLSIYFCLFNIFFTTCASWKLAGVYFQCLRV